MKSHEAFKAELLEDPDVWLEYEELGPEFEFIRALVAAHSEAGLSQAQEPRPERRGLRQQVVRSLLLPILAFPAQHEPRRDPHAHGDDGHHDIGGS